MILLSQQMRIIKSVFYSFKNQAITNMSVTDSDLKRNSFYKHQKFETMQLSDFKLMILYLVFSKRFSSLKSVLVYLNGTDYKELKKQIPYFITNYKNEFRNDKEKVQAFDKKIGIIVSLYKQNKITFLFLYHYMYHNQDQIQGRIQKRLFNDLSLFLSYFSKIKIYLETQETQKIQEGLK